MPAHGQALGDHTTAARTDLAGERRVDRYHSPTGAHCLVGEDAQELAPASILDGLGKVVILEHVGRLQVFVIDGVVLLDKYQRGLLVEISALTLHLEVLLGQQPHSFAPAVASLFAPRDATLRHLEPTLGLSIPTWVENARAI